VTTQTTEPPAGDDEAAELDLAPLGDDATAADIAASAEAHAQAAAAARAQAGHARTEAEEILATAKERAGQILAAAEEQAAPLRDQADEAGRQARELDQTAAQLSTAAKVTAGAEQDDARAAALIVEWNRLRREADELTTRAAGVQEQVKRLGERRRDLETQLAGAVGDDDLAVSLSGKISALAETENQLAVAENRITTDIAAARARIGEINREDPPLPPYPAPSPPITSRRFRALCLVDEIWPGRPGEAERRPGRRALNGGASYTAPEQQQPRRSIVVTR
jgi:hypothetical protein